jgi:hypothetical protein
MSNSTQKRQRSKIRPERNQRSKRLKRTKMSKWRKRQRKIKSTILSKKEGTSTSSIHASSNLIAMISVSFQRLIRKLNATIFKF